MTNAITTLLRYPLPARWQWDEDAYMGPAGRCYHDTRSAMAVIETLSDMPDGRDWHHLSVSFPDRVPTYDEMKLCKEIFVGPGYRSLLVFPEKKKHVNIHPYCLHLWTCLGDDGLPDFAPDGTI